MRTIFAILFSCFFVVVLLTPGQAQFDKGNLAIGIDIRNKFDSNLNYDNREQKAHTDVLFLPNLSLFVTDRTALGMGAGYRIVRNLPESLIIENDPNQPFITRTSTNSSLFVVSVFLQRYYWFGKRVGGVLDVQGNFQTGQVEYEVGNKSYKANRVNAELGPAFRFIFLATDQLGLEVGYEPVRLEGTNVNRGFTVSGNFDPMILLGLRIFVP